MWNFLKADLQELVAVVKEDAASLGIPVVEGNAHGETANTSRNENQQLGEGIRMYNSDHDAQKTPAQMEAERRMNLPETFTTPLLPQNVNSSNRKNDTEKNEETMQENLDSEPIINESALSTSTTLIDSPDEEADDDDGGKGDGAGDSENVEMDEHEVQQIQEYLKSFNIHDEQIQQDIAYLLEEHTQTLRIQYETLVPEHVTHEEFWERYFYRCDVSRIEMEWDRDEDEEEAHARDGPRRGAKIVTSVTSFFGDAARAVATGMSNALTEDLESYDTHDDDIDDAKDGKEISSTARGLATSLFGHAPPSHRPPFVMNTAVDEDADVEEEEIGWDDDDEEEEEEEQIVFDDNVGGPVMSAKHKQPTIEHEHQTHLDGSDKNDSEVELLCEQLKEQLKQAIEERDILHQTVSLQTKEIASLKSVTMTAAIDAKNDSSSEAVTDIDPNARTDANDSDSNVQLLQGKVQELSDLIHDRDNQILEMQKQYETDCQVQQERVLEIQNSNKELQLQMREMERSTSIERNDLIESMQRLEAEKVELQEQLRHAQADAVASQAKIIDLEAELVALQEQLKLANESRTIASQPVIATGIDASVVGDTTTNMSSSGELTTETGVKVIAPHPPTTVVSKMTSKNEGNGDDEEEEGWGDDWD